MAFHLAGSCREFGNPRTARGPQRHGACRRSCMRYVPMLSLLVTGLLVAAFIAGLVVLFM
jgi:hypothetical protein